MIAVLDASHQELTNEKTFYVEISRARDRAIIVTDDRMQLAETLAANSGEAVSALQGIGAEPMTTRGMATEAQMADTIRYARDDSSMSLEEREAEWAEMPPIEAEREYGAGQEMAADPAARQADAAPHQGAEKRAMPRWRCEAAARTLCRAPSASCVILIWLGGKNRWLAGTPQVISVTVLVWINLANGIGEQCVDRLNLAVP